MNVANLEYLKQEKIEKIKWLTRNGKKYADFANAS